MCNRATGRKSHKFCLSLGRKTWEKGSASETGARSQLRDESYGSRNHTTTASGLARGSEEEERKGMGIHHILRMRHGDRNTELAVPPSGQRYPREGSGQMPFAGCWAKFHRQRQPGLRRSPSPLGAGSSTAAKCHRFWCFWGAGVGLGGGLGACSPLLWGGIARVAPCAF